MLGIEMLIDVEPWDGMRLGNLSGVEMAIHGLILHDEQYDVATGPWGLNVKRNGKPWIKANKPVILRNLLQAGQDILHVICWKAVR